MPKSNKKTFPQKAFLEMHFDTWNGVLTIPAKIWNNGGEKAHQKSENGKKHSFSPAKSVFPQIYSMGT